MLNSLFSSLYSTMEGSVTLSGFLVSIFTALVLGALMAVVYMYRSNYTKSFAVTLATLPAIVCVVIMMVSGNLGAGVAVAGTFSLVRFRSVPGTAREIGAVFLAMAVGLACGMGYPEFAVLFSVIMCMVNLFYTWSGKPYPPEGYIMRQKYSWRWKRCPEPAVPFVCHPHRQQPVHLSAYR